jgi:hypothetical protein
MATVWVMLRAGVRVRWRGLLGLALLAGLVGAIVITAAAGARRTDTAYPRLLSWASAAQATVIVTNSESAEKLPAGQPAGTYFTAGGRAAEAVRRRYFAALARLPEVASAALATEYNMALPSPGGGVPDTGVSVLSSPDGSLGVTGDRPKVTAGRMLARRTAGEAVIDPALAGRLHLGPGGTLRLIGIPKDADGTADLKLAVPLTFRVTGIAVFDDQVVPTTATTAQPRVLLSAAFAATDAAVTMTNLPEAAVRLRPGASMAAFLRDADALRARYGIGAGDYTTVTLADQAAATERAIRPQALALAVFAALVGLIGLAVTGQLLARQLALDADEFPALRAIGMTRTQLAAGSLAPLAVATAAGAAIAVVSAVAASPLMPIGPARTAEPHAGVDADLAVLAIGFAVTALAPVFLAVPAAVRAARPAVAGSAAAPAPAVLPPRPRRFPLSARVSTAGSVTAAVGVRMALAPGRGRRAVPARTALASTAVAVAAVTASVVFGTSLLGLVGTPARYGQNWDVKLDAGYADIPASYGARLTTGLAGLAGYALGNNGELSVDGMNVPAIGIDPVPGKNAGGYLTLLAGRAPAGAGEIALGAQTLRALHKGVGQTVRVRVTWRGGVAGPPLTRTLRITGMAVLPAFGLPALAGTDLGSGAVVATALLSGITTNTGCDGHVTCYNYLLLRMRPGTDVGADAAVLRTRIAHSDCPPGQCTVTADQRPGDIKNYAGVRDTPLILAAALALLAAGALVHVLVTSVRRGRRDLAVLKTLGFTRGQVRRAVAWSATALAAAALLIGVPAGVIAGRWAWALFAGMAGVGRTAVVQVPLVLLMVPATVLLANLIAGWPAWAAARMSPASALRTE